MISTSFPLPDSFTESASGEHASQFVLGPLYPGYGRTLGNALRRVLLSSLPGTAITSVKIEGIQHEFSTLPGVKEDIVDILMNLKQVYLRSETDLGEEPVTLHVSTEGAGHVVAGDFEKRAGITVMNPKLHIATLTDKAAKFDMTVTLGQGRGYDPIESRTERIKEIGMIAIDAAYAPVLAVGYHVSNVRVGQMTNWDQLTLSVETNGVMTPREAVLSAVTILADELASVKNLVGGKQDATETTEELREEQEE